MIVKYNSKELDLLARLMRAEALSEGNLGMLMVGNVGINRVLADCIEFKNICSIYDMIYQNPGGFSGIKNSLFQSSPTTTEKNLAKKVLNGEYFHPATNALWFYAPKKNDNCKKKWYNQDNCGKYKHHCFYEPDSNLCNKFH